MGVWAATAVVTGEAISLGIFLTPAGMARSLGSPALLAAVWCGMALITLAGALCFTELAVRNPHDGGEYLYLRRGFGAALLFFTAGWPQSSCIPALPLHSAWAPSRTSRRLFPYPPSLPQPSPPSSCSLSARSIISARA